MPTGAACRSDPLGDYARFKGGTNSYSAIFSGHAKFFVTPQFNFPAIASGRDYSGTVKIDYDFGGAKLTSITAAAN